MSSLAVQLPGVAGARAREARALADLEEWRLQRSRLSVAIRIRYLFAAVGFALALGAYLGAIEGSLAVLLACPAAAVFVNAAADRQRRRDLVRPWHFWALQAFDTCVVAAVVAAIGRAGYIGLAVYVSIAATYAVGLPRAARVQLASACVAYPVARLASYVYILHAPAPAGLVALETVCLGAVGLLAVRGPIHFTYRVRRARRALLALERGEFGVRLPTRVLDDVGFLAESFNHTAAALGGAVAALRESEVRHRQLFDASPLPMWVYDLDTLGFLAVNDAAVAQYGWSREEFLAMTLVDIRPPEDAPALTADVAVPMAPRKQASEWRHRTKAGRLIDVAITSHAIEFNGRAARLVLAADVTDRKAAEAELAHHAYHDALTGLANRARFRREVGRALADAAERGTDAGEVAVLLLDLDGFKRINDSAGHAAGDALLVRVAERLLHATRGCDVVARLGGDEFAVLLAGVRYDADLAVVAQRIVRSLAQPFTVLDLACVVGASVGIARGATPNGEAGGGAGPDRVDWVDALVRNADLALYEAKARGKGQHAFFAPAMHAAAVERVALEAALRRGLERGEFYLAYQPIVDLADGRVVGVEALVRWQDPARGLVSPAQFIPLAEETGLVVPLGRWVLEEACRQGAEWNAARNGAWNAGAGDAAGVQVAVNVSGRQLARPEFVGEVEAALAASGLAPRRLTLELTESTVIHQPDLALERLTALKALGVRLAIDDFGTGYSALSYLQRFPIDVLKIDKSFVDRVAEGGQAAALAAAIVALGRALSLRTVAEGVERADQQHALADMGCALGQGYLFARPLAPAAVGALLAREVEAAVGLAA